MKEDFLEDIKKAISSTTRAIAEDKEIDVVFEDNLSSTHNKIVLPKIDNNEDLKNLNQLRGHADNEALRYKYHNKETYIQFEPSGEKNRKIYEVLENTRIQLIGSKLMRGVKSNLKTLYEQKFREKNLDTISKQSDLNIEDAIDLYLRNKINPDYLPSNSNNALNLWKKWLNNKIVLPKIDNNEDLKNLNQLRGHADNEALRYKYCLLYTSPSPRDRQKSRMPSSA